MNYINDLYIDVDNTCDDKATQDYNLQVKCAPQIYRKLTK